MSTQRMASSSTFSSWRSACCHSDVTSSPELQLKMEREKSFKLSGSGSLL